MVPCRPAWGRLWGTICKDACFALSKGTNAYWTLAGDKGVHDFFLYAIRKFFRFIDKKIESYKITGLFLYLWKNMSVVSENKKRVWWYAF